MPDALTTLRGHVQILRPDDPVRLAFSICTLVSRPDQYAAMLRSFQSAGFEDACVYFAIDNSMATFLMLLPATTHF